jgi:hypothetical protein
MQTPISQAVVESHLCAQNAQGWGTRSRAVIRLSFCEFRIAVGFLCVSVVKNQVVKNQYESVSNHSRRCEPL